MNTRQNTSEQQMPYSKSDVLEFKNILELTLSELTNQQLLKILCNEGVDLPNDTCRAELLRIYCVNLVWRRSIYRAEYHDESFSGIKTCAMPSILHLTPSTPTQSSASEHALSITPTGRPKRKRQDAQQGSPHTEPVSTSDSYDSSFGDSPIVDNNSSLALDIGPGRSSSNVSPPIKKGRGRQTVAASLEDRLERLQELRSKATNNNLIYASVSGRPALGEQIDKVETQIEDLIQVVRTQRKGVQLRPTCTERIHMITNNLYRIENDMASANRSQS